MIAFIHISKLVKNYYNFSLPYCSFVFVLIWNYGKYYSKTMEQ